MATTHELMDAYDELLRNVEDAEAGDDSAAIEAAHESLASWLDKDMPSKVAAILADSRRAKAAMQVCDDEAKAWRNRKAALKARIDRNMGNALRLVDMDGGRVRLPGDRIAHVVERETVTVQIAADLDPAEIPYNLRKTTITPDKAAIKASLLAGQSVVGCALSESVTRRVSERNS